MIPHFGLSDLNTTEAQETIFDAIGWIGYHFKKLYLERKAEVVNFVVVKPPDFVGLHSILTLDGQIIPEGLHHSCGYKVCNGNITYSYETGNVLLRYLSTGRDEDGYPIVKNTYKYVEAIKFFIMRRLMEGGHKHPTLSYKDVDEKAEYLRGRAANEFTITLEDAEYYIAKLGYYDEGELIVTTRYTDRSL